MWTVEKLKDVVAARGESFPNRGPVGQALLAHERYRGRTEEGYDKDKAYNELTRILERMEEPFPDAARGEYPGMRQLRVIAREFEREREDAKRKAEAEKADALFDQQYKVAGALAAQEREDDHEEELEM